MNKVTLFALAALWIAGCTAPQKPMDLTVATFNIRMDNPGDSLNAWPNRKQLAAGFVTDYRLDIFGTQEVMHHQLTDLLSLLPDYRSIGVGREDGKEKGEYSAIFYNKNRFKPVASNTFWLAEDTTAVGKKGWDAACERVVTWALMEEITTGQRFYFVNTHFDHIGPQARINSAKLIGNKVKMLAKEYPVITTGDFNAEMSTDVYAELTQSAGTPLVDARSVSQKVEGPAWSFHAWGKVPEEKRSIIDYIFITDGTTVHDYKTVFDVHDGLYITDHCPIVVRLTLNSRSK